MKCEELFSIFPGLLLEAVEELALPPGQLQEIRIRANRPLLAVCGNREYRSKRIIKKEEIREILAYLSNYSLYAYEEELSRGFLSLPGGHRVGIAGRTVLQEGRVRTVTEVSSLNLRFAHEVRGCADRLLPYLRADGRLLSTLIASAPGHGKTTLLRDLIRQVSDGSDGYPGLTVGVVDERSEIAGTFRGLPGNDVGMRTDVLDGCPKEEGMMMLIRSMAPKAVAVDEIGSRGDTEALLSAMNCGCVLFSTVHGSSMEELLGKPVLREMMDLGLFERYVFLDGSRTPGRIRQILGRDGRVLLEGGSGC